MEHSAADYETGTFPHLAARVRLLKEKKEGIDIMCDILEKERAEGKAEGKAEGMAAGIAAFILDNLEEHKTEEQILAKLVKRFSLRNINRSKVECLPCGTTMQATESVRKIFTTGYSRRCRHWLLRCGRAKTVRFLTRPLIRSVPHWAKVPV